MKPDCIKLPDCEPIPILYEDRSVVAVDKPRGWMLLPVSWQNTSRNLQAAFNSSIAARDFWSRSRSIKFLRYIHRLDGDTSGILLFARSPGALETYARLFEGRRMEKTYLAVVAGSPREMEWTCQLRLAPDPRRIGRMKVDAREGKDAETRFRVLQKGERRTLIEARPFTGRTHQIRVHLAEAGLPIVGDELYGRENIKTGAKTEPRHLGCYDALGLRAVRLAYADPFTRRRVHIQAPTETFLHEYGFDLPR